LGNFWFAILSAADVALMAEPFLMGESIMTKPTITPEKVPSLNGSTKNIRSQRRGF
jgi:hypothetical protein